MTTINLYLVKILVSYRYLLLFDIKLLHRNILLKLGFNVGFENFGPLLIRNLKWVFYSINFVSNTAYIYWS